MDEPTIISDAVMHFGGGVAVSLIDYATYRATNKQEIRLDRNKRTLDSIDILLQANMVQADGQPEAPRIGKDSVEYGMNVRDVREYLKREGIGIRMGVAEKIGNYVSNFASTERLNNASWKGKLLASTGIEVLYDSIFGFGYYTQVLGESPVASFSRNLYQIPAFFAGLYAGKGIRTMVDFAMTSSEERKQDRLIRDLLKTTPIISIVSEYEPSDHVKEQMGAGAYARQLASGAGRIVSGMRQHGEKTRAREDADRAERKRRFDDLTKDG